ncbi:hypothetical protein SUBVAR_05749 [Subdoligranulum variabile DSM 15176]|uniref:Uncharacterized protein n=1 Tax=Subdoligranulum variabile DSM 15176 TaxID=411471 RepID=D1PN34_9FIRM|nr:hypothetical protein SUBVAR_05749 [Subdoligranulum variabile DSM 15176]
MFAVKNRCYLFQGKCVLFNGKRTINGTNAVVATQCWVSNKLWVTIQSTYQFSNLSHAVYNFICDFKGWLFVVHFKYLMVANRFIYYIMHRSSHLSKERIK